MSEQLDLDAIEAAARAQARYASTIDSTHVSIPLRDVLALVAALRKAWAEGDAMLETLFTLANNANLDIAADIAAMLVKRRMANASGGEPGGGG